MTLIKLIYADKKKLFPPILNCPLSILNSQLSIVNSLSLKNLCPSVPLF